MMEAALMTVSHLDHLRSLSEQIRHYDELAERLRSRAERLTTILTGMPHGSPDHDQMAEIVAQIVDNERYAAERVIQLRRECKEAETWIDALPEQQQRVMRAYYIDSAASWQDVADRLPYSYRHTRRIRDTVFNKLGKDDHICPLDPC